MNPLFLFIININRASRDLTILQDGIWAGVVLVSRSERHGYTNEVNESFFEVDEGLACHQ